MRKEFRVEGVTRQGRFYELTLREAAHSGATRTIRVKRQNMPKSDQVSEGVYTSFRGRVPASDEVTNRRSYIVSGNFLVSDGAVTGTITIDEPATGTTTPPADDADDDHHYDLALFGPVRRVLST